MHLCEQHVPAQIPLGICVRVWSCARGCSCKNHVGMGVKALLGCTRKHHCQLAAHANVHVVVSTECTLELEGELIYMHDHVNGRVTAGCQSTIGTPCMLHSDAMTRVNHMHMHMGVHGSACACA